MEFQDLPKHLPPPTRLEKTIRDQLWKDLQQFVGKKNTVEMLEEIEKVVMVTLKKSLTAQEDARVQRAKKMKKRKAIDERSVEGWELDEGDIFEVDGSGSRARVHARDDRNELITACWLRTHTPGVDAVEIAGAFFSVEYRAEVLLIERPEDGGGKES